MSRVLRALTVAGLVIITIVSASCAPAASPPPTSSAKQVIPMAIRRGVEYLKSQYSEEVGLLRESPEVAPFKYWLFNDNALAAYALATLDEPNMASKLKGTLERYGYTSNGLLEIVWGVPVNWPPHTENPVLLKRIGSNEVWREARDGAGQFQDWMEYTNLAMMGALNQFHRGNGAMAIQIFQQALKEFNGVGFQDKAFKNGHGHYETYKLALALYTGVTIKAPLGDMGNTLAEAMLQKQSPSGGFHTLYDGPTTLLADPNTETTSLVLLALNAYLNASQ